MHWLVFTDLDGTLLDSESYSFAGAEEAISFLKKNRIPLIPCTSKTHTEVDALRKKLGIHDPFITENGSAIFIEHDYFPQPVQEAAVLGDYSVLILGRKYTEVIAFLDELKREYGLPARGFHEMDTSEIAERTGLRKDEAALARKRLFSEPFILLRNEADKLNGLRPVIEQRGFRLLQGNRFYHLLGRSDKGRAMLRLKQLFQTYNRDKQFKTIAIGDSLNDRDMLLVADFPVLVSKTNGVHQQGMDLPHLVYSQEAGPRGFADAVLSIIKKPKNME